MGQGTEGGGGIAVKSNYSLAEVRDKLKPPGQTSILTYPMLYCVDTLGSLTPLREPLFVGFSSSHCELSGEKKRLVNLFSTASIPENILHRESVDTYHLCKRLCSSRGRPETMTNYA